MYMCIYEMLFCVPHKYMILFVVKQNLKLDFKKEENTISNKIQQLRNNTAY